MTDTPNLAMPFIDGGQAQKHVTHNEALRILDTVAQLAVLDMTRTAPPGSPVEGQRHVVAASPTGAWSGRASQIATWQDGAWQFIAPKPGFVAWNGEAAALIVWSGAVWLPVEPRATNLLVGLYSDQSVTTGVVTKIAFDTVVFDSGGYWDAANKRYRPLVAGTYAVNILAEPRGTFAANSQQNVQLRKNGTTVGSWIVVTQAAVTLLQNIGGSTLVQLNGTTDYLEGFMLNNATGTPIVRGFSDNRTFMSAHRIGP